jgi:hypothetical protein
MDMTHYYILYTIATHQIRHAQTHRFWKIVPFFVQYSHLPEDPNDLVYDIDEEEDVVT